MDSSITRRGQPCWYRNEEVGLIAINDAFILEAAIYWLLKKHFRADPSYINLIELFHEVRLLTRSLPVRVSNIRATDQLPD